VQAFIERHRVRATSRAGRPPTEAEDDRFAALLDIESLQ
jgi:hypothetical protein